MPTTGPIRLLLVDDNEEFRATVLQFLRSQPGMAVIGQAVDGRSAVAQTRSLQPDVVLMDVRMPVLNGLEATRQIGEDTPGVRVIMLLPVVTDEYRTAARDFGAAGSVAKERLDEELIPAIVAATAGDRSA